jgi:hypothetical protein
MFSYWIFLVQTLFELNHWSPVGFIHMEAGKLSYGNLFSKIETKTISSTHFYMFLKIFEANFPVQNNDVRKTKNNWITQGIKISCTYKGAYIYVYNRSSNNPHEKLLQ